MYAPTYGVHYRFLISGSPAVYTVTREDDSKLCFQSLGPIDYMEDRSGNRISMFYTDHVLDSIKNVSGRLLKFDHGMFGRITGVYDGNNSPLVIYNYAMGGGGVPGSGNLEKVRYQDQVETFEQYSYGTGSVNQFHIQQITSSDSPARNYQYDAQGRAIQYTKGTGFERVNLSWNVNQSTCPDTIKATSTSPNGTAQHNSFWSPDYTKRMVVYTENADCNQCATTLAYDGGGMKKTIKYADGRVDSMGYDARGNLLFVLLAANSPDSQRTKYEYHSGFNLPLRQAIPSLVKSDDSSIRRLHINTFGNVTKVIDSSWLNATTRLITTDSVRYDSKSQVIFIDGPRPNLDELSDITTFQYDSAGGTWDLQQATLANGDIVKFGPRNQLGRPTWIRGPNGDTARFTFDVRGRMVKVVSLSGATDSTVTTFAYDVDGKLISSTSPKGSVTTMRYNGAGYLDTITNPLSQYAAYAFDSVGNPTSEKVYTAGNTLRKQQSFTWDNKNQLTNSTGNYGDFGSFAYGLAGKVDSVWGPLGHQATYYYDILRQVDSVIQRNGTERIKTRFLNDGRGNLTKVTDPDNWQYLYKYDDRNRLTYDSNCITGVTRYGYDKADNLLWKKNAAGDSIAYEYDALNRLTKIAFPDSQNIYYRFDSVGYPYWRGHINQDSTSAVFTKYKYDLKGRLIQEIRKFASDTATYTTTYHYDKDDNLDTLTYPSGRKVAYTYDAAGNVTQVKDSMTGGWAVLVDSVSYAPFGGMEAWKLGNGMWLHSGLDSSYRLDSVSTHPDTLVRLKYVLDSVGNLTDATNLRHSNETRKYTYDALDRLTSAYGLDSPDTLQQYFYGWNGNLWRQIRYGTSQKTWTYEFNCNKVWHITTIALYITYDALGNVIRTIEGEDQSAPPPIKDGLLGGEATSGPSGPPAPDTITYQYNKSGTMKSINSGGTASYYYDAWLRRVKKTTGGGSWSKYIPGPSGQVLAEYSAYESQRDHVYLNGLPIARLSSAAGERVLYAINDRTGAPMMYIDSAKTTKWRGRFYPYGEMYSGMVSTQNYHRYPGQWWDDESGLHYNWHRYYSPRIGRYYQADPIGLNGGANQYGYGGGNPLRFADPLGLDPFVLTDPATWPTLPEGFVDFSAGFGDDLLLGFGDEMRDLLGIGGVDKCSGEYSAGSWTGFSVSILAGAGWGKVAAGAKTATTEFSHFIPKRIFVKYLGRDFRNLLTGNWVTPARHAMQDYWRRIAGKTLADKLIPVLQQLDRFPRLPLGFLGGVGWSLPGLSDEDCTCKKK